MMTAAFPVLNPREVRRRRILGPVATLACLTSPEWMLARKNVCLVGPPGTDEGHVLVALGAAPVRGAQTRYLTPADLVETLHLALTDNSGGRIITPDRSQAAESGGTRASAAFHGPAATARPSEAGRKPSDGGPDCAEAAATCLALPQCTELTKL
jgi:hypothetical protein